MGGMHCRSLLVLAWLGLSASCFAHESLPVVTQVIVHKSERRLMLMQGDQVLRSYHVALGLAPTGDKQSEGDFRTPEGHYLLTRRNPRSNYFLSMLVSYPNDLDRADARKLGMRPGGAIMVHGLPNDLRKPMDYYSTKDWTNGCIALSNSDMIEFWLLVKSNTPIDIQP